ncbi:MAG: UbiD family decarboxylase [Nitrososphaeria archaeon]
MTKWKDLRDWIKIAQNIGELKEIEGADPNLEISYISQLNAKKLGPALLFKNIKGFEKSRFRVLTNAVNNLKLFNLTFGLDENLDFKEVMGYLRNNIKNWETYSKNYKIDFVSDSPILENVEENEKLNLLKFPVPIWHEGDGGPYIGTGVGVITKDPDTGWINVGTYRAQLFDKKTVGINMERGKHGRLHMEKYFSKGEPMPIVMVFGPDPLLYVLAGSEVPFGVSELDYEGAIMGESVKAIQGKVTSLPIPANSEIAVEGFVYPNKTKSEGPHCEWLGYYASGAQEKPYVDVKALYYRNDAILLGSPTSKGSYNNHAFWRSIWKSALIWGDLDKLGVPGVEGVYAPTFGVGRQFVVVSIKQLYPGHATEVGYLASQVRSAAYMGKWVVVVDEDVDPYDIDDVLWAICVRADPAEVAIVKKAWADGTDPLRPKDIPPQYWANNRGIIFATVPYERKDTFPTFCAPNKDKIEETYKKWAGMFSNRW